jgi:hypothetical protein
VFALSKGLCLAKSFQKFRALTPLFGTGARASQIGKITVIFGKTQKTNIQQKINKF